jgi:hypothetical protein
MKRVFILCLVFVLAISLASAHQPRLVFDKTSSIENPFIISNPEVSQAFYGELKGMPDYYLIDSENFSLYLSILSPAGISNERKDFSVEVNNGEIILNGTNFTWTKFFEEFAGDNYWQGPEIEVNASAGKYLVKVSNPDNTGKYSLVVGRIESFPFGETVKTIYVMPKLKTFFETSPFTAFFNIIGLFLFGAIAIIITLILIIRLISRSHVFDGKVLR